MICLTGVEILLESVKELTDTSDSSLDRKVSEFAKEVQGVQGIRYLRTRSVGSGSSLVDLTILIDPQLSVGAASGVAERVRWEMLKYFPEVMDVFVKTEAVDVMGPMCPLLVSEQRDPEELQAQLRKAVVKEVESSSTKPAVAVGKVTAHFNSANGVLVECFLQVGEEKEKAKEKEKEKGVGDSDGIEGQREEMHSLQQARAVMAKAKKALLLDPDVVEAAVYLDLL